MGRNWDRLNREVDSGPTATGVYLTWDEAKRLRNEIRGQLSKLDSALKNIDMYKAADAWSKDDYEKLQSRLDTLQAVLVRPCSHIHDVHEYPPEGGVCPFCRIEALLSRLERVEEALGEATEWNWLDEDMPKDVRERIEAIYEGSPVEVEK